MGASEHQDSVWRSICASEDAKDRDSRQRKIAQWAVDCFGEHEATSLAQRGLRLLEESIEAAQAAGVPVDMAHKMVDFVFGRPVGQLAEEIGGVGITTLALANAAGLSAETEELREANRVLSKPRSHFVDRNKSKNDAGFLIGDCAFCGRKAVPVRAVVDATVCADPVRQPDKPMPPNCAWRYCARATNGAHNPDETGMCKDCGKPAIAPK